MYRTICRHFGWDEAYMARPFGRPAAFTKLGYGAYIRSHASHLDGLCDRLDEEIELWNGQAETEFQLYRHDFDGRVIGDGFGAFVRFRLLRCHGVLETVQRPRNKLSEYREFQPEEGQVTALLAFMKGLALPASRYDIGTFLVPS